MSTKKQLERERDWAEGKAQGIRAVLEMERAARHPHPAAPVASGGREVRPLTAEEVRAIACDESSGSERVVAVTIGAINQMVGEALIEAAKMRASKPAVEVRGVELARVTAEICDIDGDGVTFALGFEGCDTAIWVEPKEGEHAPRKVGQRVIVSIRLADPTEGG